MEFVTIGNPMIKKLSTIALLSMTAACAGKYKLSESADTAALEKYLRDLTRDSSVQKWVVVASGGNF